MGGFPQIGLYRIPLPSGRESVPPALKMRIRQARHTGSHLYWRHDSSQSPASR